MKTTTLVAILAAISVAGCRRPQSAADRCRMGNAFSRIGQEHNRTANAVENARCDNIEIAERAEERENERDRRESERERAKSEAQMSAYYAELRRAPRGPEIGAPLVEAKAICEQQKGQFATKAETFGCNIGGATAFAGIFDGASRIVRTDVYYENADLGAARRKLEESLGPSTGEERTPDGFRAFLWKDGTIVLAMYPRGVRMSTIAP